MRTKEEILEQLRDTYQDLNDPQERALVAKGLLIEVLIDIRDIMNEELLYYRGIAMPWPPGKGGGE